jgi:hypothetical protein
MSLYGELQMDSQPMYFPRHSMRAHASTSMAAAPTLFTMVRSISQILPTSVFIAWFLVLLHSRLLLLSNCATLMLS